MNRYTLSPAFHTTATLLACACVLIAPQTALATSHSQTSWDGGPTSDTPVTEWTNEFGSSERTSWRSIPGQIALTALPTTPTGAFVTSAAPLCRTVCVGDLDGDGDVDLATALPLTSFPGTGKVRWYENAGDGTTWTEHEVDDDFIGGSAITAADLDGDGDADLIASAFYGDSNIGEDRNGRYVWYENLDGAAGSWEKHTIAEYFWGTEMVATADIDEDGDLDIYGCSSLTSIGNSNDDIYWFENGDGAGTTWIQHRVDDDFPSCLETVASDIDGDGDLDLSAVNYGDHDTAWWENEGGGLTWTKHVISTFSIYDNAIASGDIDDDGDMDLVASGFNADHVAWWENVDGAGGSWTLHVVGAFPNGSDVVLADLDGDGRLDVLAASSASANAEVAWFRNTAGGASFIRFQVDNAHDRGKSAIAADIDGDGGLEVLFTQEGASAGDISGIQRRTITSFRDSGQLDSAVLDAGTETDWTSIDWDAASPTSTTLALQVRASNDPDDLGPWSPEILGPGSLAGLLDPGTRYLQYRVLLGTTDPSVSPVVRSVLVEENTPAGVPLDDPPVETPVGDPSANPDVTGLRLFSPQPNPAIGASRISFELRSPQAIRWEIVGADGRRIEEAGPREFGAGRHELDLPDLPPGVYLVRVVAANGNATRKLVHR